MPFIKCARCCKDSSHLKGSLDELKYMRVMDTTRSDGKQYFCSPDCYLDWVFLRQVFGRAGIPYEPGSPARFMYDESFEQAYSELSEYYHDVVREARESWGFQTYLQRIGHPGIFGAGTGAPRSRIFRKRKQHPAESKTPVLDTPAEEPTVEPKEELTSGGGPVQEEHPALAFLLSSSGVSGAWADE